MKIGDSVTTLPLVGPAYAKKLERLDIKTIEDLVYHAPFRYLDFSKSLSIRSVQIDEIVVIRGKVDSIKNNYTRGGRKIQIANISDSTGTISCVWFNQPFLVRTLKVGTQVALAGKAGWYGRKKAFISPEYEIIKEGKTSIHTSGLVPIYHETSGISSKWIRGRISFVLPKTLDQYKEFLPNKLLSKYDMELFDNSIKNIHFPNNSVDAEKARERLSFNELLMFQSQSDQIAVFDTFHTVGNLKILLYTYCFYV